MITLKLVQSAAYTAMFMWSVSAIILIIRNQTNLRAWDEAIQLAKTCFHEIKGVYPVLVAIDAGCSIALKDWENPKDIIGTTVILVVWWFSRDIDDDDKDRWKRRKDKLTEKISQIGSRLVVQPIPARAGA